MQHSNNSSLDSSSKSLPMENSSASDNSNNLANSGNYSGSANFQRAGSFGGADNKRLPFSRNRLSTATQSGFTGRNSIRLKKTATASTNRSGSSREECNPMPAAAMAIPVNPRKTYAKVETEEDELDRAYSKYLGNFILAKLALRQEKKILNKQSLLCMQNMKTLWVKGVPKVQAQIMNKNVINKVQDLELSVKIEKGLDDVIAIIEAGLSAEGDQILSALHEENNILRIRNLRLRAPINIPDLVQCLKQFKEYFIEDETNAFKVMAKLKTAECAVEDSHYELLELNEDEVIPYKEVLKAILSLELTASVADEFEIDLSLALQNQEEDQDLSCSPKRGIWSSTPRTFHESGFVTSFSAIEIETPSYESLGFSFSP